MFVMSEAHTRVVRDKLPGSSFSFGPAEEAQSRVDWVIVSTYKITFKLKEIWNQ